MKSTLIPAHLNCIWNLVFPKFKFNLSKFEGYLDKLMENAIAVFPAFIGRWSLFWKTEILILSGSGEFAAMPSQIRNDGLLSDHLSSVYFIFLSLRFDSRSFDLARIIRDNETLFRKTRDILCLLILEICESKNIIRWVDDEMLTSLVIIRWLFITLFR